MVFTCIVLGFKNSKSIHLAGVSYVQFPGKDRRLRRLKAANNHKYGENIAMENLKKNSDWMNDEHIVLDQIDRNN